MNGDLIEQRAVIVERAVTFGHGCVKVLQRSFLKGTHHAARVKPVPPASWKSDRVGSEACVR
jgi:hypothetical protein